MSKPFVAVLLSVAVWTLGAVTSSARGRGLVVRVRPEPPPKPPPKRTPIPGAVVYRSAFEKGETDGWSSDKALTVAKATGRLGPLHNQTVRLALPKLRPHRFLHLRVDLHLADTWDGSAGDADSPDTITVKLAGGRTLMHASFAASSGSLQTYPDSGSWARHPARTGAVAHTPGGQAGTSTYWLALTFPHTDGQATVELIGRLAESQAKNRTAANESWSIGKVVVSTLAEAPTKLDEKRFAELWGRLADKDPVKANQVARTLIAAGPAVLGHIEKAMDLSPNEATAKQVAELIRQLDEDDWRVRQSATDKLKALGKRAHRQLREALAGRPSPEVRSRIEDILSIADGATAGQLRLGRARWVLQAVGGRKAQRMLEALPVPKPIKPPTKVTERNRVLIFNGGEAVEAVQVEILD